MGYKVQSCVNLGVWETSTKNVWFEIEFKPYPHFLVYDFEAKLTLISEKPTDDLTYLSRHTPIGVAINDTFCKEPVHLVDKIWKHLIERFIKVLTEKQEAIVKDALKQHPYPLDF